MQKKSEERRKTKRDIHNGKHENKSKENFIQTNDYALNK